METNVEDVKNDNCNFNLCKPIQDPVKNEQSKMWFMMKTKIK